MKNLSELIAKHEEIYGDQSQRITSVPTTAELRMTQDEKRKKQKRRKEKRCHPAAFTLAAQDRGGQSGVPPCRCSV